MEDRTQTVLEDKHAALGRGCTEFGRLVLTREDLRFHSRSKTTRWTLLGMIMGSTAGSAIGAAAGTSGVHVATGMGFKKEDNRAVIPLDDIKSVEEKKISKIRKWGGYAGKGMMSIKTKEGESYTFLVHDVEAWVNKIGIFK